MPRTPHRRTQEMPGASRLSSTAPRPLNSGLNSSIVGIGELKLYCLILLPRLNLENQN